MTPVPVVSGAEAIAVEQAGFEQVGQRGSHIKLRNHEVGHVVIVPLHRELARGTLRSILRQAGLTVDEFMERLK